MGTIDTAALSAPVRVLIRFGERADETLVLGERTDIDPGLALCHVPAYPLPWLVVDLSSGHPVTPGAKLRKRALWEAEGFLKRQAARHGITVRELLTHLRAGWIYGEGQA